MKTIRSPILPFAYLFQAKVKNNSYYQVSHFILKIDNYSSGQQGGGWGHALIE